MISLYNTLSKKKETFVPRETGKVSLYVCGMTVYDYCHIGHARVMLVFDMVVRVFRYLGYDVTYVKNITDIDDKIIQRANENQETIGDLTERFIEAMREDERALGVIPPTLEPKATTHMAEMIAMITTLIQEQHAYAAENGDVYFDVTSFKTYGQLSHRRLEDLQSGARVEINVHKKHPMDFVLWKASKPEEPSWPSPWGDGRPGWHIECSAMSVKCLGTHFDIHGGGMDLAFPHHENEIAQSEAATKEKCANTWMHIGFVQVDKEKMSKSLGNFFTIREVLERYHPEVIRLFMLTTHYRQPLNYSDDALMQAKETLDSLYLALRDISPDMTTCLPEYEAEFKAALYDDLNTPKAFVVLHTVVKALNYHKQQQSAEAEKYAGTLLTLANSLGLLQTPADEYFTKGSSLSAAEIETLIEERALARQQKNFARSDEIRDHLASLGIILDDTREGTSWRKA